MPWHLWQTEGESLYDTYVRMRDEFRADPAKQRRWHQLKDELDTAARVSREEAEAEEDMAARIKAARDAVQREWRRPRGRRHRRG